jgi:hypothetical protein
MTTKDEVIDLTSRTTPIPTMVFGDEAEIDQHGAFEILKSKQLYKVPKKRQLLVDVLKLDYTSYFDKMLLDPSGSQVVKTWNFLQATLSKKDKTWNAVLCAQFLVRIDILAARNDQIFLRKQSHQKAKAYRASHEQWARAPTSPIISKFYWWWTSTY